MDDKSIRGADEEFARLLEVVRELRLRCPWDREQTLEDSARHLIEEAYESAGAIEDRDNPAIADELGDLLVQVLFAANIAEQAGRFEVAAMIAAAREKLVRRHPHVYGADEASSADEVIRNWERIKRDERRRAGAASALDGVARAMPALMRAQKLGERARGAGMDWDNISAVIAKVGEELDEIRAAIAAGDREAAAEEIGDAMLALANAPRFVGHEAETTLRRACDKFVRRFKEVERIAAADGLEPARLGGDELEQLWQRAKRNLAVSKA